MSFLRNITTGLRSLFRKEQVDRDLDEELRAYQEMAAEAKMRDGITRQEALRTVRLERGNLEVTKEVVRSAGWESVLETSWHDLRYGLRQLRKNQALTAVCVLTLAIGIGATTAIFSVVDSLLLRPLPYPNSHRIVRIWNTFSPRGLTELTASEPEFLEYHQSQTLAHVAGFALGSTTLTGHGDPARLSVSWGTSDFFPVLGTQTVLGRSFSPDEQERGHDHVVILSHHLWRDRFGSNPAIIGKSVILNGKSCTVIGVMPANFRFPSGDVDLWQPLPIAANSSNLVNHYLNLVGDLKPQVRFEQSNAELKTILARIEQKYPAYYSGAVGIGVNLVPLREQMVGNVRPMVLVLIAGVSFMLLIACTNIASLLLAHGEVRKKEIATRIAIGAGRARIVRQLLAENLLLFLAGGAAGLVVALLGLRLVPLGQSLPLQQVGAPSLDFRVLSFAAITCVSTGLLFGLIPALRTSHPQLNEILKENGRDAMGSRQNTRTRSLLVMSEIAFSLVLLAGAGLMIASLMRLLGVQLGFDPANAVTMRMSLPELRYPNGRFATFYKDLQQKVRSIPSVRAVAIVNQLPMSDVLANSSFEVEGRQLEAGTNIANTQVISPDYFSVMRIPLIRGRVLDERDLNPAPSTVVVNQSLARKIWPEEDAIGKRLRLKTDAPWLTVVGVVSDIKNEGLNKQTKPELYFLYTEKSFGLWADLRSMTLVVRTSTEPQQMASAIRGQLNSLDSDLPIYKLQRLGEIVSASTSQTRMPAVLLSVFAGNALLLAAMGVYGVLAYTVAQSRHEIGVRMALGAPRQDILKLFLGHGLKWAALGGSAGLVAAFILVRFMRSMLFEVGPYDPTIFLSVAGVLAVVVLMACYFPASRASSVDPMIALRYE
jgi:putative ABC transport system permease protein